MKSFKNYFLLFVLSSFVFITACQQDDDDENMVDVPPVENITVWAGSDITFTKASGANPNEAANQDRLTDNVWITRGNQGGQIYNAVTETSADQTESPAGTLWAEGTTDDLENLEFRKFRAAVGNPQDVVGKNLVLLLVEDEIAVDLRFTSWAQSQQDGFAYIRSTP